MPDNEIPEIKIPKLPKINQALSEAVSQSEGVQAHHRDAAEKRKAKVYFLIGVAVAVLGIAAGVIFWLCPR